MTRRRYARPHEPTYSAAHNTLRRLRGRADALTCTDCPNPALQWSYNGGDPRELTDPDTDCRYSANPDYYSPRCCSCHRRYDWAARRPPMDPRMVIWLYECGVTINGLAEQYSRGTGAIRTLLQSYGVHIRAGHQNTRWLQRQHQALNTAPPSYSDWLKNPTINNATAPQRLPTTPTEEAST
jgi:hypothetical protein